MSARHWGLRSLTVVAFLCGAPALAAAQVCVGVPAGPGHLALRASIDREGLSGLFSELRDEDVEVIASGQHPSRLWAEAGWGYRTRGRQNNDRHRLLGGVGYSIPVGRDSVSICPLGRIVYEADDLFTEPETLPVHRGTTVHVGVGVGHSFPKGEQSALLPFISVSLGYHDGPTRRVGAATLELGLSAVSAPGFLLAQIRANMTGELLQGGLRLGAGIYF